MAPPPPHPNHADDEDENDSPESPAPPAPPSPAPAAGNNNPFAHDGNDEVELGDEISFGMDGNDGDNEAHGQIDGLVDKLGELLGDANDNEVGSIQSEGAPFDEIEELPVEEEATPPRRYPQRTRCPNPRYVGSEWASATFFNAIDWSQETSTYHSRILLCSWKK